MIAQPRLRQLGLGELLDQTFRLYRNNFITFIALTALVVVPYTLLSYVVQLPMQQQLQAIQQQAAAGVDPFSGSSPIDLLSGFLFSIVGSFGLTLAYLVFFQPLMEGALAHAISQRYLGREVTLGDSFGTAMRHILALIGARLIPVLLSIFGFIVIFGVAFAGMAAILGISLSGDDRSTAAGAGAVAGLVFCMVGLIIVFALLSLFVSVRLLFTSQSVVLEHRGAWESVVRSWRLTERFFWRTLGYLLVIGLMVFFISLVPTLLFVTPVQFIFPDQIALQLLVSSLVGAVTSVIITPFSLIAYTLMYYDLRVRKEGFDLEQQATAVLGAGFPVVSGQ